MSIWYVQPDTGGSGSGSSGDPWDGFSDITWGGGGVIAGDTLILNTGFYEETLTVGASGSSDSIITITCLAGAIIDASGLNYGISMNDRDYITINNIVCHSATFSGINGLATCVGVIINAATCYSNGANGIRFRDSQNVTINDSVCYLNTFDGILFDTTATGSPVGNRVTGGFLYSNGSEGIMVQGLELTPVEQKNARISNVTSYGNGAGIYTQASDGVIIENCVAHSNIGAIGGGAERYGIAGYKATNCLIRGNTIYGNSNHGIELNDTASNGWFCANLIYGVAAGKYGINTISAAGVNLKIANNVITSNGTNNISIYCGASVTLSFCGNNTLETVTGTSCVRFSAGASGWSLNNNIFTGKATTQDLPFVLIVAQIANNCYFATGVLATYNGTDYTSSNITDLDTNAIAEDPDLDGNYLPGNANLYESGVRWWSPGPNPVGYDGEPIADWSPSIGVIQSRDVPFHPLNL